jgi:hypothetical protein
MNTRWICLGIAGFLVLGFLIVTSTTWAQEADAASPPPEAQPAPAPETQPDPPPEVCPVPSPVVRRVPARPVRLSAPGPEMTRKLVEVKHADSGNMAGFLQSYGVQVSESPSPNWILLMGPPDAVAAAEAGMAQVDVPEPPVKNIEVLIYLVKALQTADAAPSAKPLPEKIERCVTELRGTFNYGAYELVDTIMLRCRDRGSVNGSGFLPGNESNLYALCQIRIGEVSAQATGTAPVIRLEELTLGANIQVGERPAGDPAPPRRSTQSMDVGIKADIDVRDGDCAIAGNTNYLPGEQALFVIVSARVLEL